jgi:hypothetical protein
VAFGGRKRNWPDSAMSLHFWLSFDFFGGTSYGITHLPKVPLLILQKKPKKERNWP